MDLRGRRLTRTPSDRPIGSDSLEKSAATPEGHQGAALPATCLSGLLDRSGVSFGRGEGHCGVTAIFSEESDRPI